MINRLEEAKLKEIVTENDESAFLAVADIAEVRGGRFKKKIFISSLPLGRLYFCFDF